MFLFLSFCSSIAYPPIAHKTILPQLGECKKPLSHSAQRKPTIAFESLCTFHTILSYIFQFAIQESWNIEKTCKAKACLVV